MNNYFDIKRFGNYFLYDLRRAKNNYGLSLLLLGIAPVIFFLLYLFYCFLWKIGVEGMPQSLKILAVIVSLSVVIFGAGAKIYGSVTGKRTGSDYLMLPASSLEKWLSMSLMVCVVLPFVLFTLLVASDGLMSLVLPGFYGDRIFGAVNDKILRALYRDDISFNLPAMLYCNWCENLLIFTLGAICFKRSKIAKTFLCLLAAGMVLSSLSALIFGTYDGLDWLDAHFNDPVSAAAAINCTLSVIYTVLLGGLLAGLYYRIRTLQH